MEPEVTLRPGDYVFYEDIESDEQAKAIADAFIAAGAAKGIGYPYLENNQKWSILTWSLTGNVSRSSTWFAHNFGRRRLYPDQILGRNPDTVTTDEVNTPNHYKRSTSPKLAEVRGALLEDHDGDIEELECIEAMLSCLSTVDQIRGYLRGNSFKYRWRYEDKERVKSLKKASWYDRKLEKLEEIEEKHT